MVYSNLKAQATESFCAAYCLCIFYPTEKWETDFKTAVLQK